MDISELIDKLNGLPQDAEVRLLWDGASHSTVNLVWLSNEGHVVLSDYNEFVHHEGDLPIEGSGLTREDIEKVRTAY